MADGGGVLGVGSAQLSALRFNHCYRIEARWQVAWTRKAYYIMARGCTEVYEQIVSLGGARPATGYRW